MLTIIIRSLIIYILVLFVFRLMGKRQLGQMQPFELVLTLILADLATIPMAEMSVPLLHGIIPLVTLVVAHYFLTLLSKSSAKMNALISGKPVIVINENGIDYDSVKKLNITIDDLFEALREAGFFSFDQILFAIMETNGKISVLPKANSSPITKEDMNIKSEESTLPVVLVREGKLISENLKPANVSKNTLIDFINKQKTTVKNIILLTSDKNGTVYFQEKQKAYKILKNSWTSEVEK